MLHALHPGTFRRLRGYYDFLTHLQGYANRVAAYLKDVDRERGLYPADADAKDRAFDRVRGRFMLPRLVRILSPFYDPSPRRMSPALEAALVAYEAQIGRASCRERVLQVV